MEDISTIVPSSDSDMVISPEPVSYMFPTASVDPEEQVESSNIDRSVERRERSLSTSNVEKTWRASFRLLQRHGHGTYILEMHHKVESMNFSAYELVVHENGIHVKVLFGDHKNITISPKVHIVNPLHIHSRSHLSLRERLGKWTVEQRKHNNSERRDKFYFHENVAKKFRSLQEVAIFILYNCFKDDLKTFNPKVET